MKSIAKKMTMLVLVLAFTCSVVLVLNACDTWVALPDSTECGFTILGKNSDRPIFDCQPLIFVPGQKWPAGSKLELEYITIPQVDETCTTMGSSPYWCWGYEEGLNEYGVAIGNEAIFTKTFKEAAAAYKKGEGPKLGLLGMDLLRLGLERGKTAREALEVITSLLEKYGQFGSGVPTADHPDGGYDNSYIIADPNEAWVLETVGNRWVAKRFTKSVTSISNEPSIRADWDLACSDLVDYAINKGWWPEDRRDGFDFARAYIDEETPLHLSHCRAMITRKLLLDKEGHVTPRWMMRIARDHYEDTFLKGPYFDAALPDFLTIDMYASPAGFTWGNTASSCVAILPSSTDELPVFWWCPTPPGNSCYIPFFVHGSKLPEIVSTAGIYGKKVVAPNKAKEDGFLSESYWWLFRDLLDKTRGGPVGSKVGYWEVRHLRVRSEFDALEKEFEAELPKIMKKAVELKKAGRVDEAAKILDDHTAKCVDRVIKKVNELREQFD
jgi:secernin